MIELYIENYRADIVDSISTMLTFTIDDIKDFAARNTTFSKTIVMPGTANNNILFGSIFDFNIANNADPANPNVKYDFNAARGAKAIILQDNIQIFKGTLRLLEIIINNGIVEYEVCVFGELGGMVAKMGNLKLEDLDFSEFDHTYNLANIVNSKDILQDIVHTAGVGELTFLNNVIIVYSYDFSILKLNDVIVITGTPHNNGTYVVSSSSYDSGSGETTILFNNITFYGENCSGVITAKDKYKYGYYYPLIDYGTYGRNSSHTVAGKHSWKYGTFRPAFFVKEFIDKIFALSGYTYDCDLFNTTRFKKLIIPHTFKELAVKSAYQLNVSDTGGLTYHLEIVGGAGGTRHPISAIRFNTLTLLGSFAASSYGTIPNALFTYGGTSAITGTFTWAYNINVSTLGGSPYGVRFYVAINGVPITASIITATTTGIISGTIVLTSITINPSDVVAVYGQIGGASAGCYFTINSQSLTLSGTGQIYASVVLGQNVKANDILPQNILQKNFISSILKLFNLYVYEDRFKDNHVIIKPYVDFFDTSYLNAIDWTQKLDISKSIKITPMSELNARYYEFNFKKDSDFWNDLYEKRYFQTYGSYIYDSQFEFANETKKIELIFSPTPLIGYQGEEKIYSSIFKRTGSDASPVEETTDSNIRILQAKKVTGVTSWDILDSNGTTVLGSYTDYPYAGHFDDPDVPTNDLNFGTPKELFFVLTAGALNVNQFNVYWSPYMAEIVDKDSKMLTVTVRLNTKDIFNLDFSKFININGSLFRLNKIEDYNVTNEDTCKAILLKVINTNY